MHGPIGSKLHELPPLALAPLTLGEIGAIAFLAVNLTLAVIWIWREWTAPPRPQAPPRPRRRRAPD